MNRRRAKVYQVGGSYAVILPRDWIRGNEVEKGDTLTIEYDGAVIVKPPTPPEGEKPQVETEG